MARSYRKNPNKSVCSNKKGGMKNHEQDDEVIEGSGNIYYDLNYKNPKEAQNKLRLAIEIYMRAKQTV